MDSTKQPPESDTLEPLHEDTSSSVGDTQAVPSSKVDDNCILFGRGKACNNNPANAKMRLLIDSYRESYQAAGRGEKKEIVLKVHKELVDGGMKFLKQEKGIDGWIEADAEEAIMKVGHAIRCNRKTKRKVEGDSNGKTKATEGLSLTTAGREASLPSQVRENQLSGFTQLDVSASLALASALTVSSTGFPLNTPLGYHSTLGSLLPTSGANPLLPLERLPIGLASLRPTLSASMQLPPPPLSGLSALDFYASIAGEHQMQQALLYEHIMRNP